MTYAKVWVLMAGGMLILAMCVGCEESDHHGEREHVRINSTYNCHYAAGTECDGCNGACKETGK